MTRERQCFQAQAYPCPKREPANFIHRDRYNPALDFGVLAQLVAMRERVHQGLLHHIFGTFPASDLGPDELAYDRQSGRE